MTMSAYDRWLTRTPEDDAERESCQGCGTTSEPTSRVRIGYAQTRRFCGDCAGDYADHAYESSRDK